MAGREEEAGDKLSARMTECIDKLASDNIAEGVEALEEMADIWARGGQTQESFNDLRKYLIQMAEKKAPKDLILTKVILAEQANAKRRKGERKLILIH